MIEKDENILSSEKNLLKIISSQYINEEDFEKLYDSSVILQFKKGEVLLKQGMKTTHLVFLTTGMVKFNYHDNSGKNLILMVSKAPAILGGANIFYDGINIFSITAIEDCEGYLIDVEQLKTIALNNSNFAMKLLELVSGMFKDSVFNFISLAHKQVNGRIAEILLYLSRTIYESETFTLNLSRLEFAEFVGCSKENVINTLRKFHNDGIIEITGKHIVIKDTGKLNKISKVG
ncbi:MAG: Crp/Fnr family transcriptional regulator [Bacteroidetes bacterium]|nr:Crp/Fnr family transcriptional regulator [Bacteroidota bacterium]